MYSISDMATGTTYQTRTIANWACTTRATTTKWPSILEIIRLIGECVIQTMDASQTMAAALPVTLRWRSSVPGWVDRRQNSGNKASFLREDVLISLKHCRGPDDEAQLVQVTYGTPLGMRKDFDGVWKWDSDGAVVPEPMMIKETMTLGLWSTPGSETTLASPRPAESAGSASPANSAKFRYI